MSGHWLAAGSEVAGVRFDEFLEVCSRKLEARVGALPVCDEPVNPSVGMFRWDVSVNT